MLALSIVVAGALLAGLLMPWVGGPALAAQQSTSLLGEPPAELTDVPPPGNTAMLAANGELITSFYQENRAPVASEQIAEVMKHAMVAIEDARFYEHGGLDVRAPCARWCGTSRPARSGGRLDAHPAAGQADAAAVDRRPRRARGGGRETLGRKLREARLALELEDPYSKVELLTATSTSSTSGRTPTASSRPPARTSASTPR